MDSYRKQLQQQLNDSDDDLGELSQSSEEQPQPQPDFSTEIRKLKEFLRNATAKPAPEVVQEVQSDQGEDQASEQEESIQEMKDRFNQILANFDQPEHLKSQATADFHHTRKESEDQNENCGDLINLKIGENQFGIFNEKPPKHSKPTSDRNQSRNQAVTQQNSKERAK